MLANHDQNNMFKSVLVLLKVVSFIKSWNQANVEVTVHFGLARLIERQARSIEARAECFSADSSNSALSVLKRF